MMPDNRPNEADDLIHIPVLMAETLRELAPKAGEVYADCTAGRGGHAAEVGKHIAPDASDAGTVVVNDADPGNLAAAAAHVRASCGANVVESLGSFAGLPMRLVEQGLKANMVLADLGFSSTQMDDGERGLSFRREGPLDMRYDRDSGVPASELVNTLPEEELAEILWEYGEERKSRTIAAKIAASRAQHPIHTTTELAEIVRSVAGGRTKRKHGGGGPSIDPATRTFQALRIAVNDELGALGSLLESVSRAAAGTGDWLASGARVGIISFHSLEDRMVKRAFGELTKRGLAKAVTRKPIAASDLEVEQNPRSRSAKLRVIQLGG